MNIRSLKLLKVVALTMAVFAGSCSSDDIVPLRDPQKTNNEVQYTWAATADSMQMATYNTYLGSNGTFVQDNMGNNNFNYWPNAHMLHVLVDGYLRTGDGSYLPKMKALLRGIKIQNGNTYRNVFNDDMLWLANASLRAYNATDDQEYKDVADFLWSEIKLSWSDNVFGGGITWKKNTPYEKNAVSNGPAIILAMRLYEIDNNPDDLEWAKKIYEWMKNTLVDPNTGLVWDGIKMENGETIVNKDWIFTYNIGTYIGAGLKLYQTTGKQQYLDDAVKTARTMLTSPKLTDGGILKDEGQGDGGLFKGILVRYLAQLILEPDLSEEDRTDFAEFLKFNARTFYKNGLGRPGMFASPDWDSAPGNRTDLTTQLSGLMLLEAAALLDEEGVFD